VAFGLCTVALDRIPQPLLPVLVVACATLLVALRLVPPGTPWVPGREAPAPRWDLPARMVVTTALVVVLTETAPVLGPRLTGLLAPFPLYASVLAVFAHRLSGPAAAVGVLRGVLVGLFAFTGFFAALGALLERAGIAAAFVGATAVALAAQAVSLRAVRARPVLVVATLNRAKGRELAELLAGVPFDVRPLADYPGAALPEETGATYVENALAKARAAARLTGAAALGDDSGIEIDALGGEPGLHSARYGGPGLDDAGRVALVLERLRAVPWERRTARFRCVVALVEPGGPERVVEGVAEGMIAETPRGTGGFGYDPIFFYPPLGRTFGELAEAEKHRVSHRGAALRAAGALLEQRR
jgi:XTP/dITP diphosphohydrolase